jgi:hypothetical protein
MNEDMMEPRTPIWARADVFWQNEAGTLCVTRGALEDTSRSGACVRVDRPIEVGSKVTIKWHREQFCAITKNIRSDGRQFLLGLRREGDSLPPDGSEPAAPEVIPVAPEWATKTQLPAAVPVVSLAKLAGLEPVSTMPFGATSLARAVRILAGREVRAAAGAGARGTAARAVRSKPAAPDAMVPTPVLPEPTKAGPAQPDLTQRDLTQLDAVRIDSACLPNRGNSALSETGFPKASQSGACEQSFSQVQPNDGHERKIMESKSLFSWFSRRQEGADTADKTPEKEKPSSATSSTMTSKPSISNEPPTGPKGDLLRYDDIYRAAGILGSRSGYDIGKVVEMLHSDRLVGLANNARGPVVLMAIEAAGTSPDDLLREAGERERALKVYEGNQRKYVEEYEARKTRENAQIEAEMVRVTAHYAERIKANLDQVTREKESLRKWQMSKQDESQRLTEVMELCAKPEASKLRGAAMAAASGASSGGAAINAPGPSPVPGAIAFRPN